MGEPENPTIGIIQPGKQSILVKRSSQVVSLKFHMQKEHNAHESYEKRVIHTHFALTQTRAVLGVYVWFEVILGAVTDKASKFGCYSVLLYWLTVVYSETFLFALDVFRVEINFKGDVFFAVHVLVQNGTKYYKLL